MRVLFLLLLSGSAAGLQFGSAAALQPAGTSRKGAPPLHSSSRHPVLVAAARKPAGVPAAAENPARPLQLTAFVFVLGLDPYRTFRVLDSNSTYAKARSQGGVVGAAHAVGTARCFCSRARGVQHCRNTACRNTAATLRLATPGAREVGRAVLA